MHRYCIVAIHNKGAPMNTCWGFIDGTARKICRPSENQEVLFRTQKVSLLA
ncbi:unnamed protein product [Acanthoscelides obtectus]|uniref:Uncharacterized protein n=1 Tax=Acanthoscelides obtectus TaxID=200917 RepID=A0A9P0VQQ4_ACAOB|nr:unnamed protein product [Acanthoscelides obtectus]CAK1687328.1 hypothetical protein AOBTE_LOCUS36236 [Acanthoscelides obtectus]